MEVFSKYDINGLINPIAIINVHNLNKQLLQVIDIFGRESKVEKSTSFISTMMEQLRRK